MPAERRRLGRPALAALAFCGHAIALSLVARDRFTRPMVRANVIAVALTLVAMAVAGVLAAPGQGGMAVLVTWLVGHFAWSMVLSIWILAGGALTDEPRR